jgi:hypothetical protein
MLRPKGVSVTSSSCTLQHHRSRASPATFYKIDSRHSLFDIVIHTILPLCAVLRVSKRVPTWRIPTAWSESTSPPVLGPVPILQHQNLLYPLVEVIIVPIQRQPQFAALAFFTNLTSHIFSILAIFLRPLDALRLFRAWFDKVAFAFRFSCTKKWIVESRHEVGFC